jgi:8-oxo-dGTP diphosphatase
MTEYVVGLAFSEQKDRIVLIKKKRGPAQLIGKWNGVGGHLEVGELPGAAMVREFKEETGVETTHDQWTEFMQLEGTDWAVVFFYCISNATQAARTTEDEVVGSWYVNNLPHMDHLAPNLRWIIPMALNHRRDRVEVYRVEEAIHTK